VKLGGESTTTLKEARKGATCSRKMKPPKGRVFSCKGTLTLSTLGHPQCHKSKICSFPFFLPLFLDASIQVVTNAYMID
jgi:hypothetical protein